VDENCSSDTGGCKGDFLCMAEVGFSRLLVSPKILTRVLSSLSPAYRPPSMIGI
jgi:hypothetical protein